MSFEKLFKSDLNSENFGKEPYTRNYKGRANVSKAALDTGSNAVYLEKGGIRTARYEGALSVRYVSLPNLSYDLLVSFFNVNTRESLVCRIFGFGAGTKASMAKYLDSMRLKRPNIEARIIGMQNGQDYRHLYDLAGLIDSHRVQLVEVDLFGSDVRHVAFDTRLGMSFEVLTDDRLYKPGELRNTMTLEQFERNQAQAEAGAPPSVSMPKLD